MVMLFSQKRLPFCRSKHSHSQPKSSKSRKKYSQTTSAHPFIHPSIHPKSANQHENHKCLRDPLNLCLMNLWMFWLNGCIILNRWLNLNCWWIERKSNRNGFMKIQRQYNYLRATSTLQRIETWAADRCEWAKCTSISRCTLRADFGLTQVLFSRNTSLNHHAICYDACSLALMPFLHIYNFFSTWS